MKASSLILIFTSIVCSTAVGFCGVVGSLPLPTGLKYANNIWGLDDVCVPLAPGVSYPDFAFSASHFPYLVFGGSYNQLQWNDWTNQVKCYMLNTSNWSCWTGIWVAGCGDLNGDDDMDLLIGDTRHLNYRDWDKDFGICYVVHNVGEPGSVGETVLDMDDPGTMATVVTITADQAQSRFGCCCEIIGDVDGDGYDDIVVGESGWGPSPTTATAYRERVSTLLRYQL